MDDFDISFEKMDDFDFDKDETNPYRHIKILLEWDTPPEFLKDQFGGDVQFDPDLTLALLQTVGKDNDGNVVKNLFAGDKRSLVFYNSQKESDGSIWSTGRMIHHTGDDRTSIRGSETSEIYLDRFADQVDEVPIIATIFKGLERNQTWGKMNARLTIINMDDGKILGHFDFSKEVPDATSVHVGSIYKDNSKWKLFLPCSGYRSDLRTFVDEWRKTPTTTN